MLEDYESPSNWVGKTIMGLWCLPDRQLCDLGWRIFRGSGLATAAKVGEDRDHHRAVPPDLQR
jgi:hypothetical protein